MNCQRGPSDKIASGQLRVENKLRVITTSTTMSGNEAKNVSADADGRPTADIQQASHHLLANPSPSCLPSLHTSARLADEPTRRRHAVARGR